MASNDEPVKKVTARKTIWDPSTHLLFVELCIDEIQNGNRPGSHFNKLGWTNLIKNLKERTGKTYTKVQLKNHWDSMKKDWKLYDRLMRIESGLGWDPVKKTVDAPPEWWDEKIKADPEFAKFKDKDLEIYHMYYGTLFRDCVAIGDKTKTPFDLMNESTPSGVEKQIGSTEKDDTGDSNEHDGGDAVNLGDNVEIQFPESSTTKRKKTQLQNNRNRSKKGKTTEPSSFELKLDTVLQALSERSTQTFPKGETPVWSIRECMEIVSTFPGFEPSSDNYIKAIKVFFSKEAREGFMIPPTTMDKMLFLYSFLN